MLTIMASLAQQESESLSQNVRLGLQYRYQQGKVIVNHKRFLGYDKDDDGNLVINKQEAEVVKRIFREYLEGYTFFQIGKGLKADGIKTGAGNDHWFTSTICKILKNEKYMGDALLQKTVTTDFLTKKRVNNKGIVPQYYVEDSHDAIIPKELFMRVQDEMDKRAKLESPSGRRRINTGKFALSNIIYCAHCGEVYQRTHWNIHGKKKIVWRCISRLYKNKVDAECSARTINETDLQDAVIKAINEVYAKQSDFLPQLKTNIQKVLSLNNVGAIAEIDNRIKEKEKTLINLIKTKQNYEELGDEIIRLREEKHQLQLEDANADGEQEKIAELETFLNEQTSSIQEFDDALVRRLLESVTVYDDKYKIRFKSGIEREVA